MSSEMHDKIDSLNAHAWDNALLSPGQALNEAREALSLATEAAYAKGAAQAHLNIGWCSYYLADLPAAHQAFVDALAVFSDISDHEGTCKALNALGVYYQEVSRLDKAIDYYTRSLETARRAGLIQRELAAMSNIGELCLDLNNPKEALDYLIRAYELMPQDSPPELVANALWATGKAFMELGNLPMAREFVLKAYGIAERAENILIATDCLDTLAQVFIAEGRYDEAEQHLSTAIGLVERTGNARQRASTLIAFGATLLKRGKIQAAIDRLMEAAELCQSINSKAKLYRSYDLVSAAYEAWGHYKEALHYYKQYAQYRAEVQSEDTAHKIRNIQVQAEIDKAQHDSEIYRLRSTELKEKTLQLEEYNRQIMSISEIGRRVTASLDYGMVVQILYESLVPLMDLDFFGIALYDAVADTVVYRHFYEDGLKKKNRIISARAEDSFTAWAFRNNKPIFIQNKTQEMSNYLFRPSRVRGQPSLSIVCMPLPIEDKVIGALMVQSYRASAYSASHLQFLQALAPYVAIAVENSLIHDRLEDLNKELSDEKRRLERATMKISHLANHDTLTGLPNRRLLFELLSKAIESAKRLGTGVAVTFIDLDDFKPVNDQYGHAAGDAALVAMAERMKSLLRASDIVARVGGDEFITVMTNIKTRSDAERIVRKLLEGMEKPLQFAGNCCSLGLSMGIAMFPEDGDSIEQLINKADAAMYFVKHKAKHAYRFWSDGH
jgi:diguanylate cyclase (GGDEF)-like protein